MSNRLFASTPCHKRRQESRESLSWAGASVPRWRARGDRSQVVIHHVVGVVTVGCLDQFPACRLVNLVIGRHAHSFWWPNSGLALGNCGTINDSADKASDPGDPYRIAPAGWQHLAVTTVTKSALLAGSIPVRSWTGAHDEHPRPKINFVKRHQGRLLVDGKWFHPTPSPAASRVRGAKRKDALTEVTGMIGGTGRSGGMPWHEDLLPGRQCEDKGCLRPVVVHPADEPVNEAGCAIGGAVSGARPSGSPPTWVCRGHLLRDPLVGVDADEEAGRRHGADGGRRSRRAPDGPVPTR